MFCRRVRTGKGHAGGRNRCRQPGVDLRRPRGVRRSRRRGTPQAARIREETPILRVSLPKFPEFWAITKHDDVMEIERHPDLFTNAPVPTLTPSKRIAEMGDTPVQTLIQMDGDRHKAHRNIINDWFKPGNVKQMQDRIDELARQSVDQMAALDGECDFVKRRRAALPAAGDPVDPRAPGRRLRPHAAAHPGAVRGRGSRHRAHERRRVDVRRVDGLRELLHRVGRRPAGAAHRGPRVGDRQRPHRRRAAARPRHARALPHHRHRRTRHHLERDPRAACSRSWSSPTSSRCCRSGRS